MVYCGYYRFRQIFAPSLLRSKPKSYPCLVGTRAGCRRHWCSKTRTVEQARQEIVSDIIASGRVSIVYLDELGTVGELPIGLGLMVLTTLDNNTAVETSRLLIQQLQNVSNGTAIINLISTIIVYKFQNLSRAEVDVMLGIELQQTRVYQEARDEGLQVGLAEGRQEGRQEGESELVLRLLTRRVGNLSASVRSQIKALPLVQVEELAEALLDFTQMSDLVVWLNNSIG
jgi:predicted transposase YdaD